ncbi:hypothetical protein J1781_18930 [Rahnella sp. C60]|uniref:hypothetical protein n=1 Tax=Rahnella perminowiae TaxID=2816244 RepID=UPI001C27E997|nr:hypothetical protein [Rahnella perminowiae]MBU9816900.1 hypothetical protein [Rahnella perminowiae]
MPSFDQSMPEQKQADVFVFLQPGKPDNLRNDFNVALCPDIIIIAPVGDGMRIHLVGVILAIRQIKAPVAGCEMDGPENIFVAFASLKG